MNTVQQKGESTESPMPVKKADPPLPGPDYVRWRIRWEEQFGFERPN
jgi:hypothetical protein